MKAGLKSEHGVVAIEMTVVLILGFVLLVAVVLLGRLTWHAIALQKAVSNVGRIVTAMPFETLTTYDVAGPLQTLAVAQIQTAAQSAGLDTQPSASMTSVSCDGLPCGDTQVGVLRVTASIRFHDTIFGNGLSGLLPEEGLTVNLRYSQSYVP